MYETDTTREGKRTSSGILYFNYSKWHFLGKTIRSGCLFPAVFSDSRSFPMGPYWCPASSSLFILKSLLCSWSHLHLTLPSRRSIKHQSGCQFSVVLSVRGRDWSAAVSLKHQVTQAGRTAFLFSSNYLSLYNHTHAMTLNKQTLTVSFSVEPLSNIWRFGHMQIWCGGKQIDRRTAPTSHMQLWFQQVNLTLINKKYWP